MLKEHGEEPWKTSELTNFASFKLVFIMERTRPFRVDIKISKPTMKHLRLMIGDQKRG